MQSQPFLALKIMNLMDLLFKKFHFISSILNHSLLTTDFCNGFHNTNLWVKYFVISETVMIAYILHFTFTIPTGRGSENLQILLEKISYLHVYDVPNWPSNSGQTSKIRSCQCVNQHNFIFKFIFQFLIAHMARKYGSLNVPYVHWAENENTFPAGKVFSFPPPSRGFNELVHLPE